MTETNDNTGQEITYPLMQYFGRFHDFAKFYTHYVIYTALICNIFF